MYVTTLNFFFQFNSTIECEYLLDYFTGGVNPPVLPCLHSMFVGKFSPNTDIHNIDIHEELNIPSSRLPENRQSLGELLVEFFRYYVEFE